MAEVELPLLLVCLIWAVLIAIASITYFGLMEGMSEYKELKLNGFTWLDGFILLMLTGIGYCSIETARLCFGGTLVCFIVGVGAYSFCRKLINDDWKENSREFLQILGLFSWSTIIVATSIGAVLYSEKEPGGDTIILICKFLVTFHLWWPLINGSITGPGILMRTLIMIALPMAFSDSKTSQAYKESGAKNYVAESMRHRLIPINALYYNFSTGDIILFSVCAIIVNGLKGTISTIQEEGLVSFIKRLNYWAAIGIIIFCIVTEKSHPLTKNKIPKEFYNVKRPWYDFTSTDPEPVRTPIIYSFLYNYNFI